MKNLNNQRRSTIKKTKTVNIYVKDKEEGANLREKIKSNHLEDLRIKIIENEMGKNVVVLPGDNFISESDNNMKKAKTMIPNQNQNENPSRMLWKKLSNFIKSLNKLNKYEIKYISSDSEFISEMTFHKKKMEKKGSLYGMGDYFQEEDSENETSPKCFSNITMKEMYKLSLKEKSLNALVDGCKNPIEKLERYFMQNPDRYILNEMDPNYLFNQKLSNKKTLMYVACQEGNYEVVKFLLGKKLNPFVLSVSDANGIEESCLQVSARWGYTKIINLFLEKVPYKKEDISLAQNAAGNPNIFEILDKYKKKHFKKQSSCFCFA